MAVLESLPGVEITIIVNSKTAVEFQEEKQQRTFEKIANEKKLNYCTVNSFIEAADNEEFAIKIVIKKPYKHTCPVLGLFTEVDGHRVATSLLTAGVWKEKEKENKCFSKLIRGPKHSIDNKIYAKPLRFAGIKISMLQILSSGIAVLTSAQ